MAIAGGSTLPIVNGFPSAFVYNVRDFGAQGDGVTSDSAAFAAANAAAALVKGVVYVPDPLPTKGYLLTSLFSVSLGVSVIGHNKHSTRLIHGYNGTMMNLAGFARLENLYLDGNGAAFSGEGIVISVGNGFQTVRSCQIIDFADHCIDFDTEASGSQSYWEDVVTYQLVGTSVGQEAVIIRGTLTALANPRTFVGIRTVGKRFIDLGPCNNVYVTASRIDGITWSDDSRGVSIVGCRIAPSVATMTIKGANHSISGCHIAPTITLGAGLSASSLCDNSYDDPAIVDSSGLATNMVSHPRVAYTPSFATSGTAPALGNGTLTGSYIRHDGAITFNIELTVGSTTTFGTGELRFGLPVARVTADVLEGTDWIADDSGTRYVGIGQIPNAVQYVRLMRDTSGLVTGTSPATWGTGDIIRTSGTYYL